MAIASNLLSLTLTDSDSTPIELSSGDIISMTVSGTDSIIKYVDDNRTVNKITVDETVDSIKSLASILIDLTITADSSTLTVNAAKIGTIYVDGSGSKVKYNEEGSAWNYLVVDETPSAIQLLVNSTDISESSLTSATATADGLTTGLLSAQSQFVQVTSAAATSIIALPLSTSVPVGTEIGGYVGANGFELRVDASEAATALINNVTTSVEAAIPATTRFKVVKTLALTWELTAVDELGAVVAAIVPDAV